MRGKKIKEKGRDYDCAEQVTHGKQLIIQHKIVIN